MHTQHYSKLRSNSRKQVHIVTAKQLITGAGLELLELGAHGHGRILAQRSNSASEVCLAPPVPAFAQRARNRHRCMIDPVVGWPGRVLVFALMFSTDAYRCRIQR